MRDRDRETEREGQEETEGELERDRERERERERRPRQPERQQERQREPGPEREREQEKETVLRVTLSLSPPARIRVGAGTLAVLKKRNRERERESERPTERERLPSGTQTVLDFGALMQSPGAVAALQRPDLKTPAGKGFSTKPKSPGSRSNCLDTPRSCGWHDAWDRQISGGLCKSRAGHYNVCFHPIMSNLSKTTQLLDGFGVVQACDSGV